MHRFRIANMNCGGCAKGVTATLRQADPLAQIDIALDTGEAAVTSAVDPARLEQALRDAGWQAERIPA
ncbi:copper chaperone [Humitalea rosea]|uniref:Copper chaperone n=1 Tax=Humitalea rosea TaxID=990373 RepID=A0A2W7ILK0_9PROT|nr:heavy-metal-associated domain-containing protein [Humitalea rosea]PZW39453.1 copper chaperone [Humitalea rosea]